MHQPPRIRAARWGERQPIAALIGETLATSPLGHWLVPNTDTRRRVLTDVVGIWVEHALFYGDIRVTDDLTAAAVGLHRFRPLPPPADYLPRLAHAAGTHQERFRLFDQIIDDAIPVEAHYHLAFLSVAGHLQHSGLGAALLAHHRSRLRRLNLPGWTATTPDSHHLYTRHGYTSHGQLLVPDGPELTIMRLTEAGVGEAWAGAEMYRQPARPAR
ncbi:N-acetyltransferase [Micromonospora sediminicola]|uniref:N-acetyltransferase n=1 Tax=Micromonospora sediminicola TaxID=946078 RepID=UPI003403D43E